MVILHFNKRNSVSVREKDCRSVCSGHFSRMCEHVYKKKDRVSESNWHFWISSTATPCSEQG